MLLKNNILIQRMAKLNEGSSRLDRIRRMKDLLIPSAAAKVHVNLLCVWRVHYYFLVVHAWPQTCPRTL